MGRNETDNKSARAHKTGKMAGHFFRKFTYSASTCLRHQQYEAAARQLWRFGEVWDRSAQIPISNIPCVCVLQPPHYIIVSNLLCVRGDVIPSNQQLKAIARDYCYSHITFTDPTTTPLTSSLWLHTITTTTVIICVNNFEEKKSGYCIVCYVDRWWRLRRSLLLWWSELLGGVRKNYVQYLVVGNISMDLDAKISRYQKLF